MLAEVAAEYQRHGAVVLVGKCTEAGGAYEPFLAALGESAFPFSATHLDGEDEGWIDRRRFFSHIAHLLCDVDSRQVVLIIDDLQWIDGSSVALLDHVLSQPLSRLLILGAYSTATALPVAMDGLLVDHAVQRVPVGPLDAESAWNLARFVGVTEQIGSQDLGQWTGCHPYFVVQVARHLLDHPNWTPTSDSLPDGVRAWVRRRAAELGAELSALLTTAAVVGREIDVVVLGVLSGDSPLHLAELMEPAVRAGLLTASTARPGILRFAHALVQMAFIETLSPMMQAALHARAASVLQEAADDSFQAEQALHHWFAAGRLGEPLVAGRLAVRIARRALDRLAHEEAERVAVKALAQLADAHPSPIERDGVEGPLRAVLGRALFAASRSDEALAQLTDAARIAQRSGDGLTIAEAAFAASMHRRHGRDDPLLLELVTSAVERCPSDRPDLQALLRVRQARLLPSSTAQSQRVQLARQGLDRLDDLDPIDRATVEIEVARCEWGPDDVRNRLDQMSRILSVAETELAKRETSRWIGVALDALNHRAAAHIQAGDLDSGARDHEHAATLANEAGSTFILARTQLGQSLIAGLRGDYERADWLAGNALEISNRRHNLVLCQMAQQWSTMRDQGRLGEVIALERSLAGLVDQQPLFLIAFAYAYADHGLMADARRLLDQAMTGREMPERNWLWLATVSLILETAVLLNDEMLIESTLTQLAPYSGQWALAGGELMCLGPVDISLGLGRSALGDHATARRLLAVAHAAAVAQNAPPSATRTERLLAALPGLSIGEQKRPPSSDRKI